MNPDDHFIHDARREQAELDLTPPSPTLTLTEINIAVAKLTGKVNPRYDWINGSDAIKDWVYDLPDGRIGYFKDYTIYKIEIMEVIQKHLNNAVADQFFNTLSRLRGGWENNTYFDLMFKSSAQELCIAFLKTVGKYK